MKKATISLFIAICFCNCSEKIKTVSFTPLNQAEFNAKAFEVPGGNISDSLKRAHDSCMGFSFDANAFLAGRKDSFFIGTILNRQSLMIVNTINNLGLTQEQLFSRFNVITNPCYEKRILHFPLKSVLGENSVLRFPNIDEALNKEINDAISASGDAEMQTGSWVYLDMQDALKQILDTAKSAKCLQYKKHLLDTSNMVLTAAESITDISFIVTAEKDFSEPLQALLKSKPSIVNADSRFSTRLFYINTNKLQITLNGFFPVVGEFMKAELK